MKPERFRNRTDAGRQLAAKLAAYANRPDILVLALPRGGVPVAFEVARALGVPLDVFLVRKLGVPGYEELAMGAVATGGVRVLNNEIVRGLGISEHEIDAVVAREMRSWRGAIGSIGAIASRQMSAVGPSFWWMTGWRPEPQCELPYRP
jgi:predicted phosphoribosyltransferase